MILQLQTSCVPAVIVCLSSAGITIQGVTPTAGVSSVVVNASDGGGLSNSTRFLLNDTAPMASPVVEPRSSTIGGVQALNGAVAIAGMREVMSMPEYMRADSSPVPVSVVAKKLPAMKMRPCHYK
jgi:hypothetical protein